MQHEYEVISCENVSPSTAVYTLRNTDPTRPLAYQPGQYASISFLKNGRPTPARCFSIASSPTEQHVLQFAMRVKGHYTTSVTKHVKPGDIINVSGPYGGFIFNVVRDKAAVFLAGGIGIAPFMSMVRYATRLKLENDIILFYSCRSADDVAFAEELMQLEKTNPHLHVIFVISDGSLHRFAGHRAVNGMLNDEMVNQVLGGRYDPYSFFICGPPPFMDAMQKSLLARGVHRRDIRTEVFGQTSQKLDRGLSWPARVYAATTASVLLLPGLVLANDIVNPITETQKKAKAAAEASEKTEIMSQHEHDIASELNSTETTGDTTTDNTTPDATSSDAAGSDKSTTTKPSTSSSGSTTTKPSTGSTGSGTTMPTKKAPVVTLTASATSITAGGSVTLNWTATDTAAGRCSASGGWGGAKNASGSETVRPTVTTTYTLYCSNEVGSQTKSVTINVTAAPVKPAVTLAASNTNVAAGTAITLTWSTTGTGPLNCTASGGWTGTRAASGNTSVTPTATTTYTLACSNSAGSDSKSVTVTVGTPATTSLSASSTTIMEGDSTTLNWSSAGTGPITCSASGGWSGTKAASGSINVAPTATTTYTLRCSNTYGAQTRSVTITVEPHTSMS